MSFPKYEKYKDSGVEWLGEVPEHWDVKRLRYLANARKGKLPSETFPNPICSTDLPYLSMEFLRGESDSIRYVSFVPNLLCAETGDIMLLWDGSNAGEFLRAKRGVVSSTLALIEPKNIQKDFLAFACKFYERQLKDQTVGMGIPHVSGEELRSFAIPYPDQNEQVVIASFLDRETAKIDELVAEQQRLIEFLKEKRQAAISHAVTRGLNPNVKLKSSGIEWIGDVPEHWGVKPLKSVVFMRSGEQITANDIDVEGPYPVFGGNGLRGFTAKFTHDGYFPLIGRQGALCGNINYGNGQFWASEHAVVVTPVLECSIFWLGETLRTMNLGQYSVTAAQPGLSVEAIGNLRIPFPDFKEQQVIADFLTTQTAKFDTLTAEAQRAIDLLQERRTALISAAVTGKIDVRQLNKN